MKPYIYEVKATVSGKSHVSQQLWGDRRFIGSKAVHRVMLLFQD